MSIDRVNQISTRKPSWMSWAGWVSSGLITALKVANSLKTLVNVETKRLILTQAATAIAATSIANLTPIAQALTDSGRSGDSVLLKYLTVRGTLRLQAATNRIETVRIMLVVDKENSGSTPAITDILLTDDVLSIKNFDTTGRFLILHDKTYSFTAGGKELSFIKIYKKLNFHCHYTGPLGTDEAENQIYLVSMASAASDNTVFGYQTVLAFVDN